MWPRICNVLLGLWLMAAPGVLGYGNPAQTNDRIAGPLIVSFAFIAISEVTRPLRWMNLPAGFWLLIAPWILGYDATLMIINDMVVGLLVAVFAATSGGPVRTRFGGSWRILWTGYGTGT